MKHPKRVIITEFVWQVIAQDQLLCEIPKEAEGYNKKGIGKEKEEILFVGPFEIN